MSARRRYEPLDYHDPTAGVGGAPPARSALPLRLVLAVLGVLMGAAATVGLLVTGKPTGYAVVTAVVGVAALVDTVIVSRRIRLERRIRELRAPVEP